jgi:predicted nucleic acid-binding protein
MKLNDALKGVRLLGIDTAPLIYFVERHTACLDLMREILKRIEADEFRACSSVVTLTEVLTQPLRASNQQLTDEYRDLLLHGRNFTLYGINTLIAELAAHLRARYRLHTPDALQIAVALDAGCEAFLCNDAGLRRVSELRVLVLDDLEL